MECLPRLLLQGVAVVGLTTAALYLFTPRLGGDTAAERRKERRTLIAGAGVVVLVVTGVFLTRRCSYEDPPIREERSTFETGARYGWRPTVTFPRDPEPAPSQPGLWRATGDA